MTPTRQQAQTICRLRPGVTYDSYGDPVESWTTPQRTRLPGAWLQHQDSVESAGDGRTRSVTRAVLLIPGAVDLTSADRVEVDGIVYLLDGEPAPHRGLRTVVYTSATAKRATG